MSSMEWALWISVGLIGLAGSSLFSGLETGLYTINRIRLHIIAAQSLNGRIIERLILRPNRMLGTLLIGNNIANYMASYAITKILTTGGLTEWQQIGVSALILTPMLFVFGEVVPKDLFANFTDRISYLFAKPLWVVQTILLYTGLLPLVDLYSTAIARLLKSPELSLGMIHPRRAVTALMKEGLGQGLLSPYQSDIIERVIHPEEPTVADAMVDWDDVVHLPEDATTDDLVKIADRTPHARFPLVNREGGPTSVVSLYDVLTALDHQQPLTVHARPILSFPPNHSRRQALVRMQREHVLMALVADERGRPLGIISIKDLVEPILGELDIW